MRMRIATLVAVALIALIAGVVAQDPPGGGRQGRGGGRGNESAIGPGQECPPGQTEVRAGRCGAPSAPPPSILDYRPKSTLKVPEHPLTKAKFPVIDYHGHPQGRVGSPEGLTQLFQELD